ncbi:MAG: CRISPR-associated helicase Cas3' [Chloroflexi bacterium]|nr:CRISPR-associated helicase Cas3' [Chloroflexota bacterium]
MERAQNKANRIIQVENLLLAHPEGLSQAAIADRLKVNRSTINRYLADLPKHIFIENDGRLKIDRTADLINVRLNLHEALAIHLASRLLATRMDRQNPHAAAALRKLGVAMDRWAPRISRHVMQSADVMDDADQRQDPGYLEALEKLTLAWAEQRKVQVWHRSERNGRVVEYLLCPYFIEPYAVGQTTHLIAKTEPSGKMLTLKIERIERVTATRQEYEIPVDFDPRDLLADAWGVWYTDAEPMVVALKFHPRVAQRVRETRWHRSEEESELQDGSILWRAKIGEPLEMLPWIRGWGADVEVLEPESLRKAMVREANRLAGMYKIVKEDVEGLFYAHSKEGLDKSEWQRLIEHLTKTANLAYELGSDAGISNLAHAAGLLHDIGKYSLAFQHRLEGSPQRVDHSTAGAQEVTNLFQTGSQKLLARVLAYSISGHHGGLLDDGSPADVAGESSLRGRLKKELQDFSAYKTEVDLAAIILKSPSLKRTQNLGFSLSFLTRMVFSTLVDADWLETETYMNGEKKPRGGYETIETLSQRFDQYLRQFDTPQNAINQKRTETLSACVEKSTNPQGIFTLTIPTGGGKTLASMAFALKHAVKHGLKRIVYVIPFTSIIDQNAAVFKTCLGNENVLEHHSNFDWEQMKRRGQAEVPDDETNKAYDKLKLASENWDIPIIVTTNVQFFESLFASQKSRCRKLHNLAKSVIIFDEAQMLPHEYMKPCMLAVQELVLNYGASTVFCTATQPLLNQFMPDVPDFVELAPDPQGLFDFYKRVQIIQAGKLTDAELLKQVNAHEQALCIVNTRKHAKGLFDGLIEEGRFHLSTLMCPTHRKATLLDIRERLKSGKPCRVISTQVMEAGIDVDFPIGFRALAGLDSIIQAAGRVNREGMQSSGDVIIFEPETEFIKRTPTYIKQTADAARSILRRFRTDPTSMEAIQAYFQLLDTLHDPQKASDAKDILACLNRTDGFDFKTAADKFKLIENNSVAVIIPYNDEAMDLVRKLTFVQYPTSILRQLQHYTVNIYEKEFETLNILGVIDMAADAYALLNDMTYYDQKTGIILPASEGGAAIFFD